MNLFFIFLIYFLPILVLSFLEAFFPVISKLSFFSIGLLLSTIGTILLAKNVSQPQKLKFLEEKEEPKSDSRVQELLEETEHLQARCVEMEEELEEERALFDEQKDQYDALQKTVEDQKQELESKQLLIQDLDAKVLDLNYEIKTLLNLADPRTSPEIPFEEENEEEFDTQVKTDDQASILLKRCLDIAQKITSSNHFSQTSPRFRDFPLQSSTLDLRRLIDALKSELGAGVFLYSQKDTKALFVNAYAKQLLGWSPDQFLHNFQEIIGESLPNWETALQKLNSSKEVQSDLSLKSKTGQLVPLRCSFGKIFTGVFRNHIIGIFYLQHASNKALNPIL